jgi:hypothetical protein
MSTILNKKIVKEISALSFGYGDKIYKFFITYARKSYLL